LRFAFLPWVLARRARASESISFSIGYGEGEKRRKNDVLLTVFIHVNGIRTSWLCFWVRVDFTWTKLANIVGTGTCVTGTGKTKFFILFSLCFVKKFLVPLEALSGGATHKGRYCSPLSGHKLCQVEKLFIFCLDKIWEKGWNI